MKLRSRGFAERGLVDRDALKSLVGPTALEFELREVGVGTAFVTGLTLDVLRTAGRARADHRLAVEDGQQVPRDREAVEGVTGENRVEDRRVVGDGNVGLALVTLGHGCSFQSDRRYWM